MPDPILDDLRARLLELPVPDGMQSFAGLPRMQYAFFPGGSGLVGGAEAPFPVGGVLVLGSNFGAAETYTDEHGALRRQSELQGRTWAPLRENLRSAGMREADCFFTNAWPMLHAGRANCSGLVPRWLRNAALTGPCLGFFRYTLRQMRPRLIVTLGAGPAAFCAMVWPGPLAAWAHGSWREIDRTPFAEVSLPDNDEPAVCVAMTHTCRPNWKHRPRFNTRALETGLLRAAWKQADGLPRG